MGRKRGYRSELSKLKPSTVDGQDRSVFNRAGKILCPASVVPAVAVPYRINAEGADTGATAAQQNPIVGVELTGCSRLQQGGRELPADVDGHVTPVYRAHCRHHIELVDLLFAEVERHNLR